MQKYITFNKLENFLVEDETNKNMNANNIYRRNWLRNNLIPQISDKGYNLKTIVKKRYSKWLLEK